MNRSIFIALSLAALALLLFTADYLGLFSRTLNPIASLEEPSGVVRRLVHDEVSWDRASEGMLFGEGDAVSTGEAGHATLAFIEGGKLDLESGTMVLLTRENNQFKLNFISGRGRLRVAPDAEKRWLVTYGGREIDPHQHDAPVTVEALGSASLPATSKSTPLTPVVAESTIRNPKAVLKSQAEIQRAYRDVFRILPVTVDN